MRNLIANNIEVAPEGLRGFGLFGLENQEASFSVFIFNKFISTAIGVMTVIAIIWFVIKLFTGAIGILASGGDKAKITEARNNITYAVVGLVIVVAAIFLIELIGSILGIQTLWGGWFVPLLAPPQN